MEEGAIVHIDYSLYNAESGDLIETNIEQIAKDNDSHQEGRTYSPLVSVVGGGALIEGFEEHLLEADSETDYDFTIPADKAYGELNSDMIEVISQDKVLQQVKDPNSLGLGAPITINGRTGTLRLWAAGRARIDFNHPLAGVSLRYTYKVTKVIEDRDEKVMALLEANTGHKDFSVEFDGDDLGITIPQAMMFDTNAAMMKFRLVTTLRDSIEVDKVSFIEVHEDRKANPEHGDEGHVHDENCNHDEEE